MADDIFDPLDITGKKAAKKAQDKNEKNIRKALQGIDKGTGLALEDYGLSIEQFENALSFFQEGFPGVMDELNAVGESSMQAAFDQYEGNLGGIDDDLIGSGRFGTSARESLQGGERSRYIRDVANINEGLGQLRSNVRLQGLGAMTGLMQGLGGAFERRGNLQERKGFKKADIRAGVQYQAPPSVLTQVAGAAGGIAGIFSDRRLKKNIERIGSYHGHNWYRFDWRDGTGSSEGVMAQEVQTTHPELVFEVNGSLAVNYGGL